MRFMLPALHWLTAEQSHVRKPRAVRPILESLEQRCLLDAGMTGFSVTNLVSDLRGIASSPTARPQQFANSSAATMSTLMQSMMTSMSTSGMQSSSSGMTSMIDMVFQNLNAEVSLIESQLLAMHPQLSMAVQMFNTALETLETDIAGHPIGGLSTTR